MLRWCAGPCGRQLPPEAFNARDGRCKGCARVIARPRDRRRYRRNARNPAFLEARRQRERGHYAKDAAWAEKKRASVRRSYWRAKLRAAA